MTSDKGDNPKIIDNPKKKRDSRGTALLIFSINKPIQLTPNPKKNQIIVFSRSSRRKISMHIILLFIELLKIKQNYSTRDKFYSFWFLDLMNLHRHTRYTQT